MQGGGFSCTSISKQNKGRGENVGCVRAGSGATGTTLEPIFDWIVDARPDLAFLENVPDVQQPYQTQGTTSSDKDRCFTAETDIQTHI